MIRIREWGSEEWTYISVSGELLTEALVMIGAALGSSPYHVQVWNAETEEWENLE